jgi:hypothetical protein
VRDFVAAWDKVMNLDARVQRSGAGQQAVDHLVRGAGVM